MSKFDKFVDLYEQKIKIPVEHEGILEVPVGKKVDDLGLDHFKKLVDKHSFETISKALINLKVWNSKQNPELSKWADGMQEKLAKWYEGEKKE